MIATLAARTALSVHTLPQLIALSAGAMLGGVGSNKLSAFVHHALDNYGFDRAPWIAKQAEEFLAHHIEPMSETKESWALTAFAMSQSIAPIVLAILAANPGVGVGAFAATLALGSLMSTENHKMAHRPSADIPLAYDIAQLLGLSLSREDHARHHVNPHGNHYAVVRDTAPEDGPAFRQWEALIYRLSGVEPNSWKHDPKLRVEALGPQAWDERAAAAVVLRDQELVALKQQKRDQDVRLKAGEKLADGEVRVTPLDLRKKAEEIPDRNRIAPADYEGASTPFVGNLRTLFARG
jgi:ubiquitin-conjugating enzyme E2 variant